MSGTSSIKISNTLKETLSDLKEHPRETYSEVIERLANHTREGVLQGNIPLQYVKLKGNIRELHCPIYLSIEVEDGEYVIYNNEYHLLVVAPDLGEGLKEINLQFEENWIDYVEKKESELTQGTIRFRKSLVSLFNETI